jgi:transposase
VQAQRAEFRRVFELLDPGRFVFLDEAAANTAMTRRCGRAPAGQRVVGKVPHGHWYTTTMIGAIRLGGVAAGVMFAGAADTATFATFVEACLVPALRPGDIVVLDNLSAHKGQCVREAVERADAFVLFLPPYSPDFNPIEKMWSKVKSLLRTAAARTKETLWAAIAAAFQAVTPQDCRGFFAACGLAATPAREPL